MKKEISLVVDSFIKRIINHNYLNVGILFFIAITVNIYYFNFSKTILYVNIGIVIIIIEQIVSFVFKNKYFVKQISINTEESIFHVCIYRYDKFYKKINMNLSDVKIEIRGLASIGSRKETFYLCIYENKKRIIKQRQIGGWNTELFIEILKFVNDYNGSPTYTDYIR